MTTIDVQADATAPDDDCVDAAWPYDTGNAKVVWDAVVHPRPLNPVRRRLLSMAASDLETARELYFYLCQLAGLGERRLAGPGFGYDLMAGAMCLRGRRLLPAGSVVILDVVLGHVARFAAGFPPPVSQTQTTMDALVDADPVRAVTVAYALCRAKDPDEY